MAQRMLFQLRMILWSGEEFVVVLFSFLPKKLKEISQKKNIMKFVVNDFSI